MSLSEKFIVLPFKKNRGNIVLVDDAGRIEVKIKDAVRHVIVKDKDGKTLFEGPVTNEAERAVMTASDARARTAEAAQQARTALERLRDQSRGVYGYSR